MLWALSDCCVSHAKFECLPTYYGPVTKVKEILHCHSTFLSITAFSNMYTTLMRLFAGLITALQLSTAQLLRAVAMNIA